MRLQITFLFLIFLTCFACQKEQQSTCPDNLESGRIIGYDFRKCACCSGYWIEVGNDTLRTFILPDDIEIPDTNLVDGLDLLVCLSYEPAATCNDFGELIDISEIRLQ